MDMYQKYTSPFGYQTGTGGIDTYGVNHNRFSLRDIINLLGKNAKTSCKHNTTLKVLPKIIRLF